MTFPPAAHPSSSTRHRDGGAGSRPNSVASVASRSGRVCGNEPTEYGTASYDDDDEAELDGAPGKGAASALAGGGSIARRLTASAGSIIAREEVRALGFMPAFKTAGPQPTTTRLL